ncbi:MAG: hypothetical protein WA957_17105 [Alteraurantiacibacter sp.]
MQDIHAVTNPGHRYWPSGLDEAHHAIAAKIHTAKLVVCDLDMNGVQGCADIRNAALRSAMIAEFVALGIMVFVIAVVSAIGVLFVHMFAAAWRVRKRRQDARRASPIVGKTNA